MKTAPKPSPTAKIVNDIIPYHFLDYRVTPLEIIKENG